MIETQLEKKIIIDKDQLWIIHNVLGSLTETPIGKYAIITNKGIILQNGCVLPDGTYISNDDELPNIGDKNGHIRYFKSLFSTDSNYNLKDFEFNFCNILENKNTTQVWKRIDHKLSRSWQGKDLVINCNVKIHSIINLHRNSYGICLNDEKKTRLGNEAIISVSNKMFILEIKNDRNKVPIIFSHAEEKESLSKNEKMII